MEDLLLEMSKVIGQVGLAGLWTILLYKVLSIVQVISILLVVFWGIGKAWYHIDKKLSE